MGQTGKQATGPPMQVHFALQPLKNLSPFLYVFPLYEHTPDGLMATDVRLVVAYIALGGGGRVILVVLLYGL